MEVAVGLSFWTLADLIIIAPIINQIAFGQADCFCKLKRLGTGERRSSTAMYAVSLRNAPTVGRLVFNEIAEVQFNIAFLPDADSPTETVTLAGSRIASEGTVGERSS